MSISLQDIFINNLKYFRKKAGYSQESLSERLDKGMSYINKIESRASFPTVQVIEQIAEVLHVRPWQLFADESCPQNIIGADRTSFIEDVTATLYKKLSADMTQIIEKKLS